MLKVNYLAQRLKLLYDGLLSLILIYTKEHSDKGHCVYDAYIFGGCIEIIEHKWANEGLLYRAHASLLQERLLDVFVGFALWVIHLSLYTLFDIVWLTLTLLRWRYLYGVCIAIFLVVLSSIVS